MNKNMLIIPRLKHMETVLFTVTAIWSDRTFELSSDTFGRSISANELAAVHGKSTRGRAFLVSIPNWLIGTCFPQLPNATVQAYYHACDVFVNFKDGEIFGMSLLEACLLYTSRCV